MSQVYACMELFKTGPAKTGPAGPLPPALFSKRTLDSLNWPNRVVFIISGLSTPISLITFETNFLSSSRRFVVSVDSAIL